MTPYLVALTAQKRAGKMVIQWESREGLARFHLKRQERDAQRQYPEATAEDATYRRAYCQSAAATLAEVTRALRQARRELQTTTQQVQALEQAQREAAARAQESHRLPPLDSAA